MEARRTEGKEYTIDFGAWILSSLGLFSGMVVVSGLLARPAGVAKAYYSQGLRYRGNTAYGP